MEPYFRERMAQDEKPWIEYIATMQRERGGQAPEGGDA